MAIDKKLIAAEISRFSHYPNFRNEKPAVDALVDAISDTCDSERHLKEMIQQLVRACKFAPLPADVYEAEIQLAEKRRNDQSPSIYNKPGSHEGSLTDGLSPEQIENWKRIAREGKTSAQRDVAQLVLRDFYDRNPEANR